ncbi:hypothetical protein M2284_004107 [Rhodococcus sp. LBL1]|nr:hypothetical protein [Rhodococcus sp. LBL1]MDH6684713.1 hypothetical protein [Rhodococcus sp. LBL2]
MVVLVMPRFIVRTWPSLVDIYTQKTTIDPDTSETIRKWNYLDPETVPCNVVALSPEESLEVFGKEYSRKKFVKLEIPTGNFDLNQQAGNLRSKDGTQRYYQRLVDGEFYPDVFNISNIGTRLDLNGSIDCYELYLELFGQAARPIAR